MRELRWPRSATWTRSLACSRTPRTTSTRTRSRCWPNARRRGLLATGRARTDCATPSQIEGSRSRTRATASAGGASWRAAVADRPRRDDDPPRRGGGGHGPGPRNARGSGPGPPRRRGRAARPVEAPGPGAARARRTTGRVTTARAGHRTDRDRPADDRTRPRGAAAVRTDRSTTNDPALAGTGRRPADPDRVAIARPGLAPADRGPSRPADARGTTAAARRDRGGSDGPPDRPFEPGRPGPDRRPGGYRPHRPRARTHGTWPRSGPGTPSRTGSRPASRPVGGREARAGSPDGAAAAPVLRPAAPAAAGRPRRGRGADRRPPPGRGGVRRPSAGPSTARRPAASAGAREAGPARDQPAAADHRARGRHAHRACRLRRPPGGGPGRRASPVRDARGHPGAGGRAQRGTVRARPRLARGSAERRDAPAQRRGGRRPWRALPDASPGAAHAIGGQGLRGRGRASAAGPRRRPRRGSDRPSQSRPPGRRRRGERAADRATERPARPARDRRRQRGPGPRADRPPPGRPLHADPDAGRGGLAQRGRGRVDPPVRGRRPAGPGRAWRAAQADRGRRG